MTHEVKGPLDTWKRLFTLGLANAAGRDRAGDRRRGLSTAARSPARRLHCLWLLVLLKLVTPPLFEIPILGRDTDGSPRASRSRWRSTSRWPSPAGRHGTRRPSPHSSMASTGASMPRRWLSSRDSGDEEPFWPQWRAMLVTLAGDRLAGRHGWHAGRWRPCGSRGFAGCFGEAYPAPDDVQDQVRRAGRATGPETIAAASGGSMRR